MKDQRRRVVKAQSEIRRLYVQLRPEGSSLRTRQRIMARLSFLHSHFGWTFYAPDWY